MAAAVAGSLASRPADSPWYRRLLKPRYQPPQPTFPIVWTLLYGDIAASSAAVIDRFNDTNRRAEARAYTGALGMNLVLNAGWSWLFFSRHKLGPSAALAAVLAASTADLTRRAANADWRAGLALSPYPLWCSFASALATQVWWLNR